MIFYPKAEHIRERYHYMLHALPVDKWEVLLAYHPPSIIQCLCYLFSPELSDCIFGRPCDLFPRDFNTDFFLQEYTQEKFICFHCGSDCRCCQFVRPAIYPLCGHLGLQQIIVCVTICMLHPSSNSGGCHEAFEVPYNI
jgi:hypothetical protein